MVSVAIAGFDDWRGAARRLLARHVPPDEVSWLSPAAAQAALPFAAAALGAAADADEADPRVRVPRPFITLAEAVACHRSEAKWTCLYRLLWRVAHDGGSLLDVDSDADVRVARDMAAQVRRDEHKMHAFLRFTPIDEAGGVRYVAWYEPDHLIVRRVARFFLDRFPSLRWSILTPDLAAHGDEGALSFTPGASAPPADGDDGVEELWRVYYTAMFNPARVNLRATLREMPLRRWRHLPEAALIPALVNSAHERVARATEIRAPESAAVFVPETTDIEALRDAAAACRGCGLHGPATQVVFGEGPRDARVVLVGEQPGDAEDLAGRPFVGPAGEVLDRALAAAAIDRHGVYLTNAVKHFSFEPRGKRRIHQTPRMSEMRACHPWLAAELRAIRPALIVCLGSTAARALLGPQARVMELRGRLLDGMSWADRLLVTIHPSAVLRSGDDSAKYFDWLVSDLRLAARELQAAIRR